jgi:hypothetical protein
MHHHHTNPPVSVSAGLPAAPRGGAIPGAAKTGRPAAAAAAAAVALLLLRWLLAAAAWAASPVLAFILELDTQAAAGEAIAIQPLASLQKQIKAE